MESLINRGAQNFILINLPNLDKLPYTENVPFKDKLAPAVKLHNDKLENIIVALQNNFKLVNIKLFDANTFFHDFSMHPDFYNQKYGTHITEFTHACWKGGYTLKEHSIEEDFKLHLKNTFSESISSARINQISTFVAQAPELLETYKTTKGMSLGEKACLNPDDHMFWDKLHPSASMHKIMANVFMEYMDQL